MPRPTMQQTKPCNECPFRKKSLKGWLGHNEPYALSEVGVSDLILSCHKTMRPKNDASRSLQVLAPGERHCAGRLIHLQNQCKRPRPGTPLALSGALDKVKPSEDVFRFQHEFLMHHTGEDKDTVVRKGLELKYGGLVTR